MVKDVMNPDPPVKAWIVDELVDRGCGQWYRYRVVGMNHHYDPPRRFSWLVPALGPDYDLSGVAVPDTM